MFYDIFNGTFNIFNIITVFYIRSIDEYKVECIFFLLFLTVSSLICILNYLFGDDTNDTILIEWYSRLRWSYNHYIETNDSGDLTSHNLELNRNFNTQNFGIVSSKNYKYCHYINNYAKLLDRSSCTAKISNFLRIPYSFSFYNLIFKKNQKLYDDWEFEAAFKNDKIDSFIFAIIKNELVDDFIKKNKEIKYCSIYKVKNPSVLSIISDTGYTIYCNDPVIIGYLLKPDLLSNLALNNSHINYIFMTNKNLKNPAYPNIMKFSFKLPQDTETMFNLSDLSFDYISTVTKLKLYNIKKIDDNILRVKKN